MDIHTYKHAKGEQHVQMQAETGVKLLHAKELPDCQKLEERCRTDSSSQFSEGTDSAHILILDFLSPEW